MLCQGAADRSGNGIGQVADMGDVARQVLDGDRILPARAFDHLGVHQAGQAGAIGGGRHRQQPQVGPQHALQIKAQRQPEVGFQRAFVDLVQDDGGHPIQTRIGLQATEQQPLGDDLDAGFR